MNTYELIKGLAATRKISVAELERTLNLSNGSISKWAKSAPNSEYISKVADYFGVSVDYLLGRNKRENQTDLAKMINNAMSYDGHPIEDHDREIILAYLEGKFGNK